jgi:hypothetical protein
MMWPVNANHFPRPATATPNASGRFDAWTTAAYVIYRGTEDASKCTFCHNPHDNRLTEQHKDWAESGHGEVTAKPWNNYDFKAYSQKGFSPANSAANDCVRCHTTTGYLRYVASGFSNIDPWGVDANGVSRSNEKQVLYCNACHDNGDGRAYGWQRRSVGQVTGYYNFSSSRNNPVPTILYSVKFPDLNTSNICLTCHTGRVAGNTIKLAKEAGANFASMSFINSHYLSAGATIFKAAGYEFYTNADKYSNSTGYNHDQIGRSGAFGTGVDGPCITCHMKPGRHTFLPVEFADKAVAPLSRTIKTLVSATCNTSSCHDNIASPRVSVGSLQVKKDGFLAALNALQAELAQRSILYSGSSYPYFFKDNNLNGILDPSEIKSSNGFLAWGTADMMGAAFNLNLLAHDYGAYAHNSLYTRRLIYDSIDFVDDGLLNYSAGTSTGAGSALIFLNGGLISPGDPAERP